MEVSYYPGCTLKNKARDLDIYARAAAKALGIELAELSQWQCCGGVFTTSSDEIATKLSSVRALCEAGKKGQKLVTVCSACYNVLKQTDYQFNNNPEFAAKVNRYLAPDFEYDGNTEVVHFLELLKNEVGFDNIAKAVKKPLTGVKVAPYYGCLLLRPVKALGFDDPENPVMLEDFIRALGAEAVYYPNRNECCGGYAALENPEYAKRRSREVSDDAALNGADLIVTACPLCRYNLIKGGSKVPVVYFTELLAEALGVKEEADD